MLRRLVDFRLRIGRALGVKEDHKEELYLDLSRGATLFDLVYWLQILFSAGIATLGLVMNSPAVIIGAMLISPLMGPILAAGLALASGDMVLGIRSITKIVLSCLLAVSFALFLVVVLPFREMTSEISSRTQPNTLDLFIALLSGAIGSIAVCRDVKGLVTSIPGVAIAVALMPPLCVAGYGFGLIITSDTATGSRVALGGGLLLITNLVAITFTAMLAFLLVGLSTTKVRERAEEWEHADLESSFILKFIERFPRLEKAREIRSLSLRFVMILVPLAVILVPLTQSFYQLQEEIARERRDNSVKKVIRNLWQEHFQNRSDGRARSTIDQLAIIEKEDSLSIDLRVFDDEPYTPEEKRHYVEFIASELGRSPASINLRLTEIPTSSVLAALRTRPDPKVVTLGQLQADLWDRIGGALREIEMPPDARLISRQVITDGTNSMQVKITYLCDSSIDPVIKDAVVDKVRAGLGDNNASVSVERIPTDLGFIEFPRRSSSLPILGMLQLDFAGRVMRENHALEMMVSGTRSRGESQEVADARFASIAGYLDSRWQISKERIRLSDEDQIAPRTRIAFSQRNE